jgi:hypothetical protein
MTKMGTKVLIVVAFFGLVGCASMSNQLGGAEGKPDSFCGVLKEPDPMLMGSWKVSYTLDGHNLSFFKGLKTQSEQRA